MFLNNPFWKKQCEEMNLEQENLIKQAPQDFPGDLLGVFVLQPMIDWSLYIISNLLTKWGHNS